jgi:hypothetical protein
MTYRGYPIARKMRRFSQIVWCALINNNWVLDCSSKAGLQKALDDRIEKRKQ